MALATRVHPPFCLHDDVRRVVQPAAAARILLRWVVVRKAVGGVDAVMEGVGGAEWAKGSS